MNIKIKTALAASLISLAVISLSQLTRQFTADSNRDRQMSKDRNTGKVKPEIELQDGNLTIYFMGESLRKVSDTIAKRAKLHIILDEEIADSGINVEFSNLPLQLGLQRLFQKYDAFFFYKNKNQTTVLDTVWVYPQGKGDNLKLVDTAKTAALSSSAVSLNPPPSRLINSGTNSAAAPTATEAQTESSFSDETGANHSEPPDINRLVEQAQNANSPAYRLQALANLSAYSKNDDAEVDASLEIALKDQDSAVRAYALQALAHRQGNQATEHLQQALQDPDFNVQIAAVENANPNGENAIVLEEALTSTNALIRAIAKDRLSTRNTMKNNLKR